MSPERETDYYTTYTAAGGGCAAGDQPACVGNQGSKRMKKKANNPRAKRRRIKANNERARMR